MKLFVKFFNLFFNLAFAAIVKYNSIMFAKVSNFKYWISRRARSNYNPNYKKNEKAKNKQRHCILNAHLNFYFHRQIFKRLRRFIHTININNFFNKITFKGAIYG